jgi:uracil-DNA glycosylase
MIDNITFPFGQPVRRVVQQDRQPKKVFVLGVYASAVHARWVGPDGKDKIRALAVASEPCVFWRGEGAEDIIQQVDIPAPLGRLVPADPQFNGPSGKALDDFILKPLGYLREDAWLCDLVPHSCVNPQQQAAIERAYIPAAKEHDLPLPSVPPVPKKLADDARREAILDELRQSQAPLLLLLGDQPIKWFLRAYDERWSRLADFQSYGQRQEVRLDGLRVEALALAHPRQVAKLGTSSKRWYDKHRRWIEGRPTEKPEAV